MTTVIRPTISENNKYYIDKHRYYELKHFCLQYKEWKKAYAMCVDSVIFATNYENVGSSNTRSDLTARYALKRAFYAERIHLIERAAMDADEALYPYILKAVTEGLSYIYLKNTLGMPCSKDMYYDRYRRFFWMLSNSRN